METTLAIPISKIKIDQILMIENHSYQYKGQQTVKRNGIKKTIYLFNGVSTSMIKEFNITKPPSFKLINDVLKMI